ARDGKLVDDLSPPARSLGVTDTFKVAPVSPEDLAVRALRKGDTASVLAIAVTPDQIFVRKRREVVLPVRDGLVKADTSQDVQYLTVIERYGRTSNRPVAFASGFGLRSGALATSTAPD